MERTLSGLWRVGQQEEKGIFGLFCRTVTKASVLKIEREQKLVRRKRVFTTWWVLWLMIWQRVNSRHTLTAAVHEMRGISEFWQKKMSSNTGAFSQARNRLTFKTVEVVVDQLVAALLSYFAGTNRFNNRRMFLIDGSSISLEHTKELIAQYGLSASQRKGRKMRSHWPKMLVVVAHDLLTGIALRPEYGAMHGVNKTGEIKLGLKLIGRLPNDAIIVADRAYGIFSVAWFAKKNGHDVVSRVTDSRIRKMLGRIPKRSTDTNVTWSASVKDRLTNPEIPSSASITGRIISQFVKLRGIKGSRFVRINVFTTLHNPPAEIIELYCRRWNIELDLRSIKSEVDMNQLTGKTVEMVKKELLLGVAAYSLIRATMAMAALKHKIADPRIISFATTLDVIHVYLPQILNAKNSKQVSRLEATMLTNIADSPCQ